MLCLPARHPGPVWDLSELCTVFFFFFSFRWLHVSWWERHRFQLLWQRVETLSCRFSRRGNIKWTNSRVYEKNSCWHLISSSSSCLNREVKTNDDWADVLSSDFLMHKTWTQLSCKLINLRKVTLKTASLHFLMNLTDFHISNYFCSKFSWKPFATDPIRTTGQNQRGQQWWPL